MRLTARQVAAHVALGASGAIVLFVTWGFWLLTSPAPAVTP